MTDRSLPILQTPDVAARVSAATRAALEQRAYPEPYTRFLDAESYGRLQIVLNVILPQQGIGTQVDLAEAIDRRLAEGINAGWRYADLPADGEAYKAGLSLLDLVCRQRSGQPMDRLSAEEVEGVLRAARQGEEDGASKFPLSKFVAMLRADATRAWMAHPSTMQRLDLYGFADGATGRTDGPTETEGWTVITPNSALPFEHAAGQKEMQS